jgi:hypothetical protein
MAKNQAQKEHSLMNQLKVREPRSDQTSQRDESQKASLRNKSLSGDKSAVIWQNHERFEKECSDKQIHARSMNVSQDESAINFDYNEKKNI